MTSILRDRIGGWRIFGFAAAMSAVFLLWSAAPAAAQIGPFGSGEMEQGPSNIFHRAPRELRQKLLSAEKAVSEERYADAVQLLASLIGMTDSNQERNPDADPLEGNDYFIPAKGSNSAVKVSLKVAAQRMLGSMPAEAREILELQFGTQARRLLDGAIARGETGALEEVSRKYFHTQAGYEATLLLGRYHLDGGRPLSAALTLQRLFEEQAPVHKLEPEASLLLAASWAGASEPAKAREVLAAWQKKNPNGNVADLPPFPGETNALDWLAKITGTHTVTVQSTEVQWKLFRGNAARTGWVSGDLPLVYRDMQVRWEVPVVNDPGEEAEVRKLQRQFGEQRISVLPQLHPLAINDTILMRTPEHVEAVDFQTGKRTWMYPLYGKEDAVPTEGVSPNFARSPLAQSADQAKLQLLQDQIWEESPIGQMSSDGLYAYVVAEDEATSASRKTSMFNAMRVGRFGFQQAGVQPNANTLAALELKSEGKQKWMVGGRSGEDDPKLAGAYFLGPPLPIGGLLYVIAEMKGEVRLIVLEPKYELKKTSIKVAWSQQLAQLDGLNGGYMRRMSPATPSFADGVLICPTGQRAVVAVDLAARSLLWGYEHTPAVGAEGQFNAAQQRAIMYQQQMQRGLGNNWADSTATIAQGKVLLTMPETNELICLDLLRGDEAWKVSRGDLLYVAGVHEKAAILVGKDRVVALNMADGKESWANKTLSLSEFGGPSGRGFQNGRYYFLPTSNRKLLKIDLAEGKVVESVETTTVLGNLVCYRDELISQGTDTLTTFYQIEALRNRVNEALKKDPKDVWALARQGEIRLRDGDAAGAEKSLHVALELTPEDDPQVAYLKLLLVTSKLTKLRADFVNESARAAELDKLIDQPKQRADFFRLMADGLAKTSRRREAIEYYVRLAAMPQSPQGSDFSAAPPALEEIDARWSVQRTRWIQARIGDLYQGADEDQKAAITAAVEGELVKAQADKTPSSLRNFLSIFGLHPIADKARFELASRLVAGNELAEAEQLLIRLEDSDPALAVSASALLGELLVKAQRPEEAVRWYQRLAARFGDQVDLRGLSAREISKTALDGVLQASVAMIGRWPSGQVVVTEGTATVDGRYAMQRGLPIQIRQQRGSTPPGLTIAYEQVSAPTLIVSDGYAKNRLKIQLQNQRGPQFYSTSPSFFHGHASGHLYVAIAGLEVVAVDALRSVESQRERVLWRQDLSRLTGTASQVARRISVQSMVNPWGTTRSVGFDSLNNQLGALGPLMEQGIYFQRVRDLVCLDPLTGAELWVRREFDAGSEIWGDEDKLFICGPDKTEALVLNPIDGTELGKRQVPPLDRRWTTTGRFILTWTDQGSERVLKLIDPWEAGREVWTYTAPSGAKGTVIERDEVAIFQPDGKFVVLGLTDGRPRVTASLLPEPLLSEIHVLRSSGQYLLAVNTPAENTDPQTTIQPAPGGPQTVMLHGRVYAFDRDSGASLWPTPAFIDRWGLPLDQPSELPVITFLRTVTKVEVSGSRTVRSAILCLDRRDGRACFERAEIPVQLPMMQVEADLAKRSVTLNIPNQRAYTLTFTDRPTPPEPPIQTGKAASYDGSGSRAGAVVKSVFDAFGKASGVLPAQPRRVLRPQIVPVDPFGPPQAADDPFGP